MSIGTIPSGLKHAQEPTRTSNRQKTGHVSLT